jgi:hypothetical protein
MNDRVPMRWPAGWTDPAALDLLKGTPVNCLVAGQRAALLREPAAKLGIAVVDTPPADVAVIDGAWPGVRLSQGQRRDDADAGPTGAPWIDSNGWVVKLARARSSKPVWVAFDPPADSGAITADRYQLAAADAAMAGGRWIVSLDNATAASLQSREPSATEAWRKLADLATFFEKRKAWRDWPPMASLAVISDFSGDNEFLATEMLNLAARRNLLYRVVDKARAAQADFTGLSAALYVDNQAPPAALLDTLARFAKGGGMVIVPAAVAAKFSAGPPAASPVDGYDLRTFGKGRLAAPNKEWDDPFLLASDAHILTSRRHDPVRIYNAPSLFVNCAARGPEAVVQLLNFSRLESTNRISVALARSYASARFQALGAAPVPLKPAAAGRGIEFYLPPFALYAALELGSAR